MKLSFAVLALTGSAMAKTQLSQVSTKFDQTKGTNVSVANDLKDLGTWCGITQTTWGNQEDPEKRNMFQYFVHLAKHLKETTENHDTTQSSLDDAVVDATAAINTTLE